jgi:hypothetical protein
MVGPPLAESHGVASQMAGPSCRSSLNSGSLRRIRCHSMGSLSLASLWGSIASVRVQSTRCFGQLHPGS